MMRAGLKASGNIGMGFGVGQPREGSRGQQWDQCCRRACAAECERRCWTRAAVLHECGTTDTCSIAGAWPHLVALPETSPWGSLQAASSSSEPGPRPWDDGRNPAPGHPAAGCRDRSGHGASTGTRWEDAGAGRAQAVPREVALLGSSPPLAIAAALLLPDVWRRAEPGSLPPQPRQHGPPLALQADQLRVAQHPAHQLLVPPDARGRILPRDGHGPQLGAWDEQIRAVP